MSASTWRRIPRGVWALGLVSLCMDLSSELVHALLPLYMATTLGASMLTIGIIEGVAEATALVVKVFSGVLSDLFARRKPLVVLGYGLAAITKLVFPLAPSLSWIVGARFVDRVGKGIRGAPRDALIADLAPAGLRGASFGLRQALDTVGGFGGPLLALAGNGVVRRQLPVGVLGCGRSRRHRRAAAGPRRSTSRRAAAPAGRGQAAPAVARRAPTAARLLGRRRHRVAADAGALFRGVPGAAGAERRAVGGRRRRG